MRKNEAEAVKVFLRCVRELSSLTKKQRAAVLGMLPEASMGPRYAAAVHGALVAAGEGVR